MSKYSTIFLFLISFTAYSFGIESTTEQTPRKSRIERTGGEILKKGSYLGRVSVISTQSRVALSDIEAVAAIFANETEMNFVAVQHAAASPRDLLKATSSAAAVIVVDDPTQPVLLFAPEEGWATVNVAVIVDDISTERGKARLFIPRVRKEIMKALSLVCGGGASEYPNNPMSTVKLRDLDNVDEVLPMDKLNNALKHLERLGVTRKEMTTYRKACQEGWAPAPTNEIQRAIWEQTHELPSEPIKIIFEGR